MHRRDLLWILSRHDLSCAARLLLVRLWSHVNERDDDPVVWPTIGALATAEGLKERGVYKLLADLRAAGLVERREGYKVTRGGVEVELQHAIVLHRPTLHSDAGAPCTAVQSGMHDGAGGPCTAVQSHPTGTIEQNDRTEHASTGGLVDGVLEAMRVACESLRGRKGSGPDDCDANRQLVVRCSKAVRRKGQTDDELLADWRAVIARQLANVRSRPDTWKYLTLSTLCRPANFLRLRDSEATPNGSGRRVWSSEQDESEDT